jgi:hypothetical protein
MYLASNHRAVPASRAERIVAWMQCRRELCELASFAAGLREVGCATAPCEAYEPYVGAREPRETREVHDA